MSQPARIALLGFKAAERAALEAFFRLALKRTPPYERVAEVEQADLIVVDADDEAQRSHVLERRLASRCVAVGERELFGAALQMPRPLNVLRLFTRIDRLRYPGAVDEPPAKAAGVAPPGMPVGPSMAAAQAVAGAPGAPRPSAARISPGQGAAIPPPAAGTAPAPEASSAMPAPAAATPSAVAPAPAVPAAPAAPPAPAAPAAAAAPAVLRGLARLTGRVRSGGAGERAPAATLEPRRDAGLEADPTGFAVTEQGVVPADMARTVVLAPGDMPPPAAPGVGAAPAPAPTLAPPLLPAHERISLIGLGVEAGEGDGAGFGPAETFERTQPVERARLALVTAAPSGETPAPPPADAAGAAPAARRQQVLVVDADDEVLRFLVIHLEPLGFALHAVRDATEALDWVAARRYHHAFVHVADSSEPGGEGGNARGVRLAAQLRLAAQDRGRAAPAVALFGTRQALVAALTREPKAFAEVEAVLALPLQRDELLDVVGGRALQKRAFAQTVSQSSLA